MLLDQLPPLERRDLAKGPAQLAVVEDEDVLQLLDGLRQVLHGPRVTRPEFLSWDVVAALKDAHGDALFTQSWSVEPDEDQYDRVALLLGALQELELVAHGIREDGLEDEALALLYQGSAELASNLAAW
jgi:hypothetical protein